ncbi:MAG: hypothetical protein E7576_12620 [Ruminococcaceae bacterium]|jgi:hypothetical protein|nr:hypothetical protein [Oscillospiraceae bacterium]
MAKKKNKHGRLFQSGDSGERTGGGASLPENAIDLTGGSGEESDSDLDINELLRKYMPEYREEQASDAKNDPLTLDDTPENGGASDDFLPYADGDGKAKSGGSSESEANGSLEDFLSESAEEKPADRGGKSGLFSRILKTTEDETLRDSVGAETAESPRAEEAPASGGVFSRIRQTVEDEESRRAEMMRSDEELLSALDSAFAYPAEDSPDGGDFQIPVSDGGKAQPQNDDVIREYEFDLGGEPQDEEPAPAFTSSESGADFSDADQNLDFNDAYGQTAPASENAIPPEAARPVGEEVTDEQVMGLFSEVKPQKKKFSLFRRNKKPKAVTADDEFLPDDFAPAAPVGAAKSEVLAPAPDPGFAGFDEAAPVSEEVFSAPSAEPLPQEDDTDALIAEATAAVFGRKKQEEPAPTPMDEWTSPEPVLTDESADGSGSVGEFADEIEAMWKQASETLSGEPEAEQQPEAEQPSAADSVSADAGEQSVPDATEKEMAGIWARFTAKSRKAGKNAPAPAESDKPSDSEENLEDAAAALQTAAEDHSVAVADEMGFSEPAPAVTASSAPQPQPAQSGKKKQPEFVHQSKRSAANLSDEELLRWAAESLADSRSARDFGSNSVTSASSAEEPAFGSHTDSAADVGEEIPDVSAFVDENGGELPEITADSTLQDLESYLSTKAAGGEAGPDQPDAPSKNGADSESGTWETPDTPYTEEEFDPTDINLMVAFDLDDGKGGKSDKAKALGDKLAARQQNRDTTVRLDRPEFVDRTQIPAIRKEYRNRSLSLFIRLILCVVFGVLLFLYENIEPVTKLLTGTGMQFGGVLDPRVYPTVYAMVSLQLMLLCCLCAYEEIIEGVKAIFIGIPKPESMTALLALAGILYSAVISHVTQSPNEPVMFNFLVGLACFMTLMSSVYQNKREMMNFRIVSSKKTKHIVRRLKDDESELEARAFAEAEDACDVMKIEKTDFIDGFFARLQKPDQTTGTFMMLVMGASVLLAVIVGIIGRIRGGTSSDVARVIYESLLMVAPLSVFISFSYPFYRANLTAKDYDSAIIGETSLEEYSNASIISFDDKSVFPSLSVKVQNVRIYNNARIDRVLYYASSVFAYAGGPLQDVFEDVTKDLGISSNVKIFETEDDFLATQVDGVNIIFGGCEKLRSRGFEIDDEAAEDDVDLSDELSIMYMFRENKLVAKMYIKYEMDPDIDSILKQFSGNGLYACVRTFDPNINEEMVSKKLSMKKMPLRIVRYANMDEVTTYEAKVDSGLVTCGQQKSLLQVIAYCGKVLRTKKTHIALTVLSILVGASIVTILELAGLLTGVSSLVVILYQLAWLIPMLITSRVFIR